MSGCKLIVLWLSGGSRKLGVFTPRETWKISYM